MVSRPIGRGQWNSLGSTHTHTAPGLIGVLPIIFGRPVPPEHQAYIDRYTCKLLDKLERAALDHGLCDPAIGPSSGSRTCSCQAPST